MPATQAAALTLRTPGPPALDASESEDALLTEASRAFSFPYPQAYKIQIELMREVFRCVEDRKIGIFESPTGTVRGLNPSPLEVE